MCDLDEASEDSRHINRKKNSDNELEVNEDAKASVENSSVIIKDDPSEENIDDEMEDKSFTSKFYGPVSKGVTQTEAQKLRDEITSMRSEYAQVLEQVNNMKNRYDQEADSKRDIEESLKNEIRALRSKIDPAESVAFELESDIRSNIGHTNFDYPSRLSNEKPLSEYAESTVEDYTIERKRNRRYK